MTDQTILSGEEIAALMSRDQSRGGDGDPGARRQPRPFSFGAGSTQPLAALPALDRINDRLAKRMRDVVEPFLRAKPRVEAEPVVIRPLRDWQAEQPTLIGLSLYSFKPLQGVLALALPADLVSRMVDAFYGGSGASPTQAAREFTATEERLHGRVADALVVALADVWREIAPIEPLLRAREVNVAAARIAAPDEPVALGRFRIQPPSGQSATIDILFPAAALRSVEGALAAKAGDDSGVRGAEFRAQLAAALGDVRIEARTVLARPELSVAELMQLKVGDVIPVSIPASVPLLVEGRTVAVGSIGEQDGKAALRIERVEPRRVGK